MMNFTTCTLQYFYILHFHALMLSSCESEGKKNVIVREKNKCFVCNLLTLCALSFLSWYLWINTIRKYDYSFFLFSLLLINFFLIYISTINFTLNAMRMRSKAGGGSRNNLAMCRRAIHVCVCAKEKTSYSSSPL
jgi:hypothetical protein